MFRPIHVLAAALSTPLVLTGCAENTAQRPIPVEVAQVCAGISDAQARTSITDLRGEVDSVELVQETTTTKPFVNRSVGADIHLRAEPGVTAQWVARLLACHAVSEAAGALCTSSECPLGLARVTTQVSATATGFTISIRSPDSEVAREIVRRCRLVLQPQPLATASTAP